MSNNTLIISRMFPYPAIRLFSKYSNADALTRWWGPKGNINTFNEFNFHDGGRWIFTMYDGATNYPNEWIFEEIRETSILMKHIVAPIFSIEVVFEEVVPNETKMTWVSTFENPDFLTAMKDFLIEKNNENFDRLEEELLHF